MEKDKCHFCTEKCVHNETADRISGLTPDGEALYEVANLFKISNDRSLAPVFESCQAFARRPSSKR